VLVLGYWGLGLFCIKSLICKGFSTSVEGGERRVDRGIRGSGCRGSGEQGIRELGDFGRLRVMMIEASINND